MSKNMIPDSINKKPDFGTKAKHMIRDSAERLD